MSVNTAIVSSSAMDQSVGHYQPTPSQMVEALVRNKANASASMSAAQPASPALMPTSTDGTLKIINLPRYRATPDREGEFFAATQEWDGYVTEVFKDYFTANLRDVTRGEIDVDEIAEIPLDGVAPQDRPKIAEGVRFRWLIGYSKTRGGQFSKRHIIYLRPAIGRRAVGSASQGLAERLRTRLSDCPDITI